MARAVETAETVEGEMLIDCDTCVVRGPACGDCVVSVLLGPPKASLELDEAEQSALAVLADAGMVPHLRLVARETPPEFGVPPNTQRRRRRAG